MMPRLRLIFSRGAQSFVLNLGKLFAKSLFTAASLEYRFSAQADFLIGVNRRCPTRNGDNS